MKRQWWIFLLFDYFTNEIKECGGKVIKIGDNNQNPAIGYKGGLSKNGDIVVEQF